MNVNAIPEYRLPAPATEAGRAIYERAVDLIGEPYSRAYAEEVRIMVIRAELEAADAIRAAIREARGLRVSGHCYCGSYVPDSSGDAGCGSCGADLPPEEAPRV